MCVYCLWKRQSELLKATLGVIVELCNECVTESEWQRAISGVKMVFNAALVCVSVRAGEL